MRFRANRSATPRVASCVVLIFTTALGATGCRSTRRKELDASSRAASAPSFTRAEGGALEAGSASLEALTPSDANAAPADANVAIGPFEVPFKGARTVYYVASAHRRLLANLHGLCNPPGYACGYWVHAASEAGFLVCPTGNARCGAEAARAPTWNETDVVIDEDLEAAIAEVGRRHPGTFSREGAILTGFSRGAYVAARIAALHPGRWPYLILNEADVSLDASTLRAAGVRAIALIAGEWSSQIRSERKTTVALEAAGFPAKLWVMKKAGHYYSNDIDAIMREAIAFVLSVPTAPPPP